MKKLLALILFIGLGSAYAQSSSAPSNFKYHDLPNGQRIFVPYSSPLPSAAQQAGQQIWNSATSNTASGQVEVARSTTVPNPAGSPVAVTARGRLPSPAVAAAVGRLASATAKSLTPIGIGFALYDLAKELGINAKSSPSGLVLDRPDPSVCTLAPCYAWDGRFGRFPTALAACEPEIASAARFFVTTTTNHQAIYSGADYAACSATHNGSGYVNNTMTSGDVYRIQVAPAATAVLQTLTQKEFTDIVAARSSWPASSKINDAILADPSPELQVPESIIASGSATSPGATSSTVNTTNNTTTNTSTTYNHNYAGDTVTTTINTTNNTTNNSTGAVTNSETTTSTPPSAPPPATTTCGLPGTPACKLDESGTPADSGITFDASKTAIDTAKTAAETAIGHAASIAAPSWSFAFQLPTGCAPYVTGIKGVVLNVCQYQSTIHGLLSAIWAAATAFAMIGMVGRTIREA